MSLSHYKIITVTHKTTHVAGLKDYFVSDNIETDYPSRKLSQLKTLLKIDELLYLKTCNRVTFFFTSDKSINKHFLSKLFLFINPGFEDRLLEMHLDKTIFLEGEKALEHFFSVAASLDSLVVGEREILGQIKQAYQKAKATQLTGDNIRLAMEQAIVFAKKIYSDTRIGEKPISIVSLAYRELMKRSENGLGTILMVGAGQTNNLMLSMLEKNGFSGLHIFNRTLAKAEELAQNYGGQAYTLKDLYNFNHDFDILITCTGAHDIVITKEVWDTFNIKKSVMVIDLAVPADIEPSIAESLGVNYIDVASLEEQANANMEFRKGELVKAQSILKDFLLTYGKLYKERSLELALMDVPRRVKAIRHRAVTKVFEEDLAQLDDQSREVLEKMMDYFEKKYIALPMKVAKKTLLNIETNKF